MAIARITQTFSEDAGICVEVEVSESYPDCVVEAVSEVVRLFSLACPDEVDGE